jgi:hypothetical protein
MVVAVVMPVVFCDKATEILKSAIQTHFFFQQQQFKFIRIDEMRYGVVPTELRCGASYPAVAPTTNLL